MHAKDMKIYISKITQQKSYFKFRFCLEKTVFTFHEQLCFDNRVQFIANWKHNEIMYWHVNSKKQSSFSRAQFHEK